MPSVETIRREVELGVTAKGQQYIDGVRTQYAAFEKQLDAVNRRQDAYFKMYRAGFLSLDSFQQAVGHASQETARLERKHKDEIDRLRELNALLDENARKRATAASNARAAQQASPAYGDRRGSQIVDTERGPMHLDNALMGGQGIDIRGAEIRLRQQVEMEKQAAAQVLQARREMERQSANRGTGRDLASEQAYLAALKQHASVAKATAMSEEELVMAMKAHGMTADQISQQVNVLTGRMGAARDRSQYLAFAVLEFSRAFEDAVVTGGNLAGVINNLPGMFMFLAMAAGKSGESIAKWGSLVGLAAAGTMLLYNSWDFLQDKLGVGVPPNTLDEVSELKERMDKLSDAVRNYANQRRLSEAQQKDYESKQVELKAMKEELRILEERKQAFERFRTSKSEIDRASADAFAKAVSDVGPEAARKQLIQALMFKFKYDQSSAERYADQMITDISLGNAKMYTMLASILKEASGAGVAEKLAQSVKDNPAMTDKMKRKVEERQKAAEAADEEMRKERIRIKEEEWEMRQDAQNQIAETEKELDREKGQRYREALAGDLRAAAMRGEDIYAKIYDDLKRDYPGMGKARLHALAREISDDVMKAVETIVKGWRESEHLTEQEIQRRIAANERQRQEEILAQRADEGFTALARAMNEHERMLNPFARRKGERELQNEGKMMRQNFLDMGMSDDGTNAFSRAMLTRGGRQALPAFQMALNMGLNPDDAVRAMGRAEAQGLGSGEKGSVGLMQFGNRLQGRMLRMQRGMLNQQMRMSAEQRKFAQEVEYLERMLGGLSNRPSGQLRGGPR